MFFLSKCIHFYLKPVAGNVLRSRILFFLFLLNSSVRIATSLTFGSIPLFPLRKTDSTFWTTPLMTWNEKSFRRELWTWIWKKNSLFDTIICPTLSYVRHWHMSDTVICLTLISNINFKGLGLGIRGHRVGEIKVSK